MSDQETSSRPDRPAGGWEGTHAASKTLDGPGATQTIEGRRTTGDLICRGQVSLQNLLRQLTNGRFDHVGRVEYQAGGLLLLSDNGRFEHAVRYAEGLRHAWWQTHRTVPMLAPRDHLHVIGDCIGRGFQQLDPSRWNQRSQTAARRDLVHSELSGKPHRSRDRDRRNRGP